MRLDLEFLRQLLQRSPRSSCSTASIFLSADQRGCDRWSRWRPGWLSLRTVISAIFAPVYPVSNPTGSDGPVICR